MAVVKVIHPVFETKEFPGSASIRALALTAGVGGGVEVEEAARNLLNLIS